MQTLDSNSGLRSVCTHVLSCLYRFLVVVVLKHYCCCLCVCVRVCVFWGTRRYKQLGQKNTLHLDIVKPLTKQRDVLAATASWPSPIKNSTQWKLIKYLFGRSNLNLIGPVMSWDKRMISKVSPFLFLQQQQIEPASILFCSMCEWSHLLIIT